MARSSDLLSRVVELGCYTVLVLLLCSSCVAVRHHELYAYCGSVVVKSLERKVQRSVISLLDCSIELHVHI